MQFTASNNFLKNSIIKPNLNSIPDLLINCDLRKRQKGSKNKWKVGRYQKMKMA